MHGNVPCRAGAAIPPLATSCQQRQDPAEPLWFAVLCRYLWGANAPKDLEAALARNGIVRSDRTCRAWAHGENPPPFTILLVLLRDAVVGDRVLDFAMSDCDAPWWLAIERAVRISKQVDRLELG